MDQVTEGGTRCEWTVSGMDCASCAGKIRDAVGKLPGVSDVSVTVMGEALKVTLDENQTGRDRVEGLVKRLGYGLVPKGAGAPTRKGFIMPTASAAVTEDHAGHDHEGHDHASKTGGKTW